MPVNEGREGTSRLDKLLRLVEEGKTQEIRYAATEQISDIVRSQPSQVHVILAKISSRLYSKKWDTRVAAAHCIGLIAKHCQHHTVESLRQAVEDLPETTLTSDIKKEEEAIENSLSVDSFDILQVLGQAKPLVASSGSEYVLGDVDDVQQQKKRLKERLGLDGISGQVLDTDEFIEDKDLTVEETHGDDDSRKLASSLIEGLSARERALKTSQMKRKQQQENCHGDFKRIKSEDISLRVEETLWSSTVAGKWVFQYLADRLCIDLLDQNWERRHGAALGLREMLQSQAKSAGIFAPIKNIPTGWLASESRGPPHLERVQQVDVMRAYWAHEEWINDCLVHLLCVIALDRFGDYVSDDVVAPVRETAGQVLGLLCRDIGVQFLEKVVNSLSLLAQAPQWEARHGALTALKYALAARKNMEGISLDAVFKASRTGLADNMEDVRSVAAECLIPCAVHLGSSTKDVAYVIRRLLWDALLSLDPLNGATKSSAQLLEAIFTSSKDFIQANDVSNVPRLWHHFRNPSTSVRRAVIQCYTSTLEGPHVVPGASDLETGLQLLLQTIVTDTDILIARKAYEAVKRMISCRACVISEAILDYCLKVCMFAPGKLLKEGVTLPEVAGMNDDSAEQAPRFATAVSSNDAPLRRSMVAEVTASMVLNNPGIESHAFASIKNLLEDSSGISCIVSSFLVYWLAQQSTKHTEMLNSLSEMVQKNISTTTTYSEMETMYGHVAKLVRNLGISLEELRTKAFDELKIAISAPEDSLHLKSALSQIENLKIFEDSLRVSVSGIGASAVVAVGTIPQKVTGLIQPLMAVVRRESNEYIQEFGAKSLAKLVWLVMDRTPCPSPKILKHLCAFVCSNKTELPDMKDSCLLDKYIENVDKEDSSLAECHVTSKGGKIALQELVRISGNLLEQKLPCLWKDQILLKLRNISSRASGDKIEECIRACHVLTVVSCAVHEESMSVLSGSVESLVELLKHENTAVRLSSAIAIAHIAQRSNQLVSTILQYLESLIQDEAPDFSKLGGVMTVREMLKTVSIDMIPYIPLTVIYLIRRMSDPNKSVRLIASACFAQAVSLMPLTHRLPLPVGLSEGQKEILRRDGSFLSQLMDNDKVDDVELPFELLTGSLRKYQQEGINWLAFLQRFGLHGILADDMGLGKTLQSTAIMAAAVVQLRGKSTAMGNSMDGARPSLVVCPATLVAHWPHEINKFVSRNILDPLRIHGNPSERKAIRSSVKKNSVVVISYETLRADIEWLKEINWLYIILDEGHAIRNRTSKLALAAKALVGSHRLILSGTPIQNSVNELWAMFDFLMPGYLGSYSEFQRKFGKSVEKAKKSGKSSEKEQNAILSLSALHRQVMPFILRRTKDQVLTDLPPKTIQDIVCDPSDLQKALLEEFNSSGVAEALQAGSDASSKGHVFQALSYLRKLCSHPLFVLNKKSNSHQIIIQKYLKLNPDSNWSTVESMLQSQLYHAPKLAALKELLLDNGIGESDESLDAGHRVLVFAQTKAMLNLVEETVLKHMQVISLRIDGDVDAAERFERVQRFNADPTIEVMLLTTTVGGLGLNLTAADTVIFLEHDWNPQKDLQAMDRAHRIGQQRAVNVYRILVRGTLEESIMSLQRFKLDVADAVVNTDNVSMQSMETDSLLDLLAEPKAGEKHEGKQARKKGLAAMLAEMPDIEETEAQYQAEFDLDAFKKKMGK